MKIKLLTAIVACSISVNVSAGDTTPRVATIEDTSGMKTTLSTFSGRLFVRGSDSVSIASSNLTVAIPTDRLNSITVSDTNAEIAYVWKGKSRTISGSLYGALEGKSDLGGFKLALTKLRRLNVTPSARVEDERSEGPISIIVLTNDLRVAVSAIGRHTGWYISEDGYANSPQNAGRFSTSDFSFVHGDSIATVRFDTVRKIEFGSSDAITVHLTSGKQVTGRLGSDISTWEASIAGWSGAADQGLVYFPARRIRAIEFVADSRADAN